ncbi:MAG: imidazole glycerol phosphate synthase subunit HisH [Lachnospiraceae bacterium]|nr:imidazole glycerol phosphate synthase subunit HisH [Lachnospiraceae bacterium]
MIAIIDYDAGNMKSVEKALAFLGADYVVTRDPALLEKADKLILPGVGAFGDAMKALDGFGLTDVIKNLVKNGKPILGICLGMQLLFDESEESPNVRGLSLLPGKIVRFSSEYGLKIPQIGWNSLDFPKKTKLFEGINTGSYVYFVHSYYLKAEKEEVVAATCEYGNFVHAAVEWENIYGCQFHPEKSSDVGLKILKNYISL